MLSIYIDNKALDVDQSTSVSITLGITHVNSIESSKAPFSKTIKLPDTPNNRSVMGFASEIYATRFNNQIHSAEIDIDGFTIMKGEAQFNKYESEYFHVNFVGAEIEWIKRATETPLVNTDFEFPYDEFDGLTVENSLHLGHSAIRFIPAATGKLRQRLNDEDHWGDRITTTLSDYVPFFHIGDLLTAIFTQCNYSIKSTFMQTPLFRSLYISGKWASGDVEKPKEANGFRAGRFSGVEVEAAKENISSQYHIIDTADPDAESEDGDKADSVYDNGKCISFQSVNRPIFTAKKDVVVGFRYYLHYFSPTVCTTLPMGTDVSFYNEIRIPNFAGTGKTKYVDAIGFTQDFKKDQKHSITPLTKYYLVLFPSIIISPGDKSLSVGWNMDTDTPSEYRYESVTSSVITTSDVMQGRAYLYDKYTNRRIPDKFWMIQEMPSEVEVKITIDCAPRFIEAGTIIPLNAPSFHGTGMVQDKEKIIGISNNTYIETLFSSTPTVGEAMNTSNLLAYDEVKQIEFIKAIKQMFNLQFLTDLLTRTVYIEPYNDFYGAGVIDWSDRIDLSQPVTVEELGADLGSRFILSYNGDDQSTLNARGVFGLPNRIANKQDYIVANELLHIPKMITGACVLAPTAQVLDLSTDGKFMDEDVYDRSDVNIEPTVISYGGQKPLPAGQKWPYPTLSERYVPAIGFVDDSVNISFNGTNSLAKHYSRNLNQYRYGKRITVTLALRPQDIEPFMIIEDRNQDYRAEILLKIKDEMVRCYLEEITDYNPDKAVTKCTFITTER